MVMAIRNTLSLNACRRAQWKMMTYTHALSNPGMHPIYTLQSHFWNHKHISTDRNENEILFFFPSSEKRFALYDRICSSLFFREYLLTSIFFFFKVRQKFYILAPDERDPKKKESICIFCLLIEIKAKLLFAFNFVDINAR